MDTVEGTIPRQSMEGGPPLPWVSMGAALLGAFVFLASWDVTQLSTAMLLAALGTLPLLHVIRWLWRTRRGALWVLLPYLLSHIVTAASAMLVEAGAYMPELDSWGYPNGAAARLAVETALIFGIAGWVAGTSRLATQPVVETPGIRRMWLALLIATGAALAIPAMNLLRFGMPLLEGIDRVEYYQQVGAMHLRLIVLFLSAAPALGLVSISASSVALRRSAVAIILLGLAVMVLSGEKFHGLLLTVYAASLPALLQRRTAVLRKLLVGGIAIVAVSIGLIIYHYSVIYAAINVGDFALWRVAGQSEVPWAIDNFARKREPLQFDALVDSELLPDTAHDQGIESLMLKVAPLSFVAGFIESGSRFTMGFPAVLTLHAGKWAVLAIIPFAIIVGLFVRLLLFSLTCNPFSLWMSMNIVGYGALLDQVLLLGNLSQLLYYEPTRFVWLFLLIGALLLPRMQYRTPS